MTCLDCLGDIITNSETIMELFSNLPGVTYQHARYTDWIQPFLMSQLNKSDGYGQGSSAYGSTSKEDIVKVMSKFEIYDAYLHTKDNKTSATEDILMDAGAEEESKEAAIALDDVAAASEASTIKQA